MLRKKRRKMKMKKVSIVLEMEKTEITYGSLTVDSFFFNSLKWISVLHNQRKKTLDTEHLAGKINPPI